MSIQLAVKLVESVDARQARDLEDGHGATLEFGDVSVFIKTYEFGETVFKTNISWPSIGAVDVGVAENFANDMLKAVSFAKLAQATYEA